MSAVLPLIGKGHPGKQELMCGDIHIIHSSIQLLADDIKSRSEKELKEIFQKIEMSAMERKKYMTVGSRRNNAPFVTSLEHLWVVSGEDDLKAVGKSRPTWMRSLQGLHNGEQGSRL